MLSKEERSRFDSQLVQTRISIRSVMTDLREGKIVNAFERLQWLEEWVGKWQKEISETNPSNSTTSVAGATPNSKKGK